MTLLTRRGLIAGAAGLAAPRKRRRPVGMKPDEQGVFFQLVVQGGGTFTYDASGNLRSANVGQTVTDPIQGITCYAGFSTFNGSGAVISLFSSTLDAQLWYADTRSSTQGALGNSIASAAGTDPFGNAFLAGITDYSGGGFGQLIGGAMQVGRSAGEAVPGVINESAPGVTKIQSGQLSATNSAVIFLSGGASPMVQITGTVVGTSAQVVMGPDPVSPVTSAELEVQGGTLTVPAVEIVPPAAGDQVLGTRISADTFDRGQIDGNFGHNWGSGVAGTDCALHRLAANSMSFKNCDLSVETLTRGLRVREGANGKQGTATLSSGTILVANTAVTASSRIILTAQDNNSTGALRVSARTAGTSFTISSSNSGDSGVVAYQIFEPA